MKLAKVKVYCAFFCYGGNGGIAAMSPELGLWWGPTYHQMVTDERIEFGGAKIYSDTPITMTRNRAVRDAKLIGADMVLMLDSDNIPDAYLRHDSTAKPFWSTAFDFAYERLIRDIPTVIAAPYCGPPPPPVNQEYVINQGDVTYTKDESAGEVPYLFQWTNTESDNPHASIKIDLMTRSEAARLSGIFPVAALPTGVCLFTLNAFQGLPQPYFKYEMNADGSEKRSTEDVVCTRDISIYWKTKTGEDVLYATCDSWAFHHKTKKVGRPQYVPMESIAKEFADALKQNLHANEVLEYLDYGTPVPINRGEILRHDQDSVILSEEDVRVARELAKLEYGDYAPQANHKD